MPVIPSALRPLVMARLQGLVEATGHAQVIAVIKREYLPAPGPAPVASAAVRGSPTAAATRGARIRDFAKTFETHFVSHHQAQDAALLRAGVGLRFRASATAQPEPPKMRMYGNLGVLLGTVDAQGLESLGGDERVEAVTGAPEISLIRPVATAAAKAPTGVTWGLKKLGIPELWKKGFRGQGIQVGHLDTGVDGTHPALKGAVDDFAEFDHLGNPILGGKPWDSGEHGTHTAGTIVGRKVGKVAFGVAPEAKVDSAIVIEGGNVIARILGGMDWVVGKGARILSMSLGLRGYTPDFLPLTQQLRALGILPVFAVGNEYAGSSRSPGNYAEALSVGAGDRTDRVADFSSSQTFARAEDPIVPDLVAPGVKVYSCVPGGYAMMDGTSMATPHVAGLAALLLQAKPDATVNDLERAIFSSCQRPPGMAVERGNRGIPNGPRALEILTQTPAMQPTSGGSSSI